jgi:ribonucleoside-triphosphate reductase
VYKRQTQRDLLAGIVAKHYAKTHILPRDIVQAHEAGDIHYHDLDYAPFFPMFNYMLIDLKGMLTHGFKMGNAEIDTPKSISTATAVTAQIIAQVASHIYGGTTINRIDEVLEPYVLASFEKHLNIAKEWDIHNPEAFAKARTEKECFDAVQSLEYEVNTLHTANGQTPFVTFGFGFGTSWASKLIQQSILKNRIAGLGKNRKTAVFPKLVFAIKDGLNHKKSDPNYDIKTLALECASKRMYLDILNYDKVVEVTGSFKTRCSTSGFNLLKPNTISFRFFVVTVLTCLPLLTFKGL